MRRWLDHPLTRGLPLDSPATTERRRQVIATKPFLRRIYEEWYDTIRTGLPSGPGRVLELGSGAGFFRDVVPECLSSDVFRCGGIQIVLDGRHLPFLPGTLRAIAMTNVLHHIADVRDFLREAARSVRPGGVIVLVEPWVTPWARLVFRTLHHEPFEPDAGSWSFESDGPLSGANGALPWIVFERDRQVFHREFPQWRVERIELLMPLRYLVSGGLATRSVMPGWTFAAWRVAERLLDPWLTRSAMFASILIRRTDSVCE